MEMTNIHVDFNNCDREGRVRLNTVGAIQSLNFGLLPLEFKPAVAMPARFQENEEITGYDVTN
jgi:hypothetical protein